MCLHCPKMTTVVGGFVAKRIQYKQLNRAYFKLNTHQCSPVTWPKMWLVLFHVYLKSTKRLFVAECEFTYLRHRLLQAPSRSVRLRNEGPSHCLRMTRDCGGLHSSRRVCSRQLLHSIEMPVYRKLIHHNLFLLNKTEEYCKDGYHYLILLQTDNQRNILHRFAKLFVHTKYTVTLIL